VVDIKRSLFGELTKGLLQTNPLMILMIGLCPALAISTRVESCIFMGAAVIFVTVCSNVIISLIRGFIPDQIRIPIFIVVIASFVTIVDLTLKTQPAIYERLGVWIPLIVCNCLILARAEGFAAGENVPRAFMDGLGIGLGFSAVILVMGFARELLGTGNIEIFDTTIISLPIEDMPAIFIMFPGAFITFAMLLACLQWYQDRRRPREKEVG
jgi:Na+-translocating ferredoxin:NAD+ oxidoreductase subunit E